ncbi:EAL domain-containing response regulator [Undibacter mobilis]|uniref:EAL domain-containing protein n=1 Tax=Undibacter mobilis TaxID=2292256 RepID=A0A371B0Q2_9BRAD|nr:EAL domain-containing response regulator [Undibacter mobilis]RDV01041.1 EAL domain-containing protein [Undibacter mobilis]
MPKTPATSVCEEAATVSPPLSPGNVPFCFVIDEEPSIRHFLSLILHGAGVDTMDFPDGATMRVALTQRVPDLIFLNIALDSRDAIETILALGRHSYAGAVQLMSPRGSAVLEHVRKIGAEQNLNMLPVLKKPFETDTVVGTLQTLNLGTLKVSASRIDLGEAIDSGWIEFWFQPKIDLRKRQLAGAEAYARARHPTTGVALPGSFMPTADESDIVRLSELALLSALRTAQSFTQLGLNLPVTVNIPVPALEKLAAEDIIRANKPKISNWAGLIIDVPEEQIIADLSLAGFLAERLHRCRVRLAIDDFGRGMSSLAKLGKMPFVELKLDRSFVTDCGTDKVNAPLCKTVIDLAHNYGQVAVAIGIEKAADMTALVSMGCDYGQGFLLGQPMPEDRFISLLRQRTDASRKRHAPAS